MPLMPGSPRPGTPVPHDEDDGVYLSLFQQPVVEIPPATPSYAWFEFLLHPEALQKHLTKLRQQKERDTHSATSAIELVREFLEQAQLVADEGNVRNKRYRALLLVAAQVVLQMQLTLPVIEKALPLHFQRLLLDGIVDFAELPPSSRNEFTQDIIIQPYEAHVLHNRWTLRALVKQSQNGYLTCSTRNEGEEILSTYQMALGDLMSSHIEIAQKIQIILMNGEKQKLTPQTQLETYFDLGVYFFSFDGYEKAYNCFRRASELVEDGGNGDTGSEEGAKAKFPEDVRADLEGYITACEAVLEVQSVSKSPASLKTRKLLIEMAWEAQNWDHVIQLLENEIVGSELTKLPLGYRAALEQRALSLLRLSSTNTMEEDPHVTLSTIRYLYKRIVMENTVMMLLLEENMEQVTLFETCVCVCVRLLQDEIFSATTRYPNSNNETKKCFADLAHFVLTLSGFAFENGPNINAKLRVKRFVMQVMRHFPCIASVEGVSELLQRCGGLCATDDKLSVPIPVSLDDTVVVEGRLRSEVAKQRAHFRMMADIGSMFAFPSPHQKDAFVSKFQNELAALCEQKAEFVEKMSNNTSSIISHNLLTFCAANNCCDLLSQCRNMAPDSSQLRYEMEFVVACSLLTLYVSSLVSSPLTVAAPKLKISTANNDASLVLRVQDSEFSFATSSKLLADVFMKWRECVDAIDANSLDSCGDETPAVAELRKVLMSLPLLTVEILVSTCAGLLHRANMRNVCDYRVSFDLSPYGDLAFLEAFAPEMPLTTFDSSTSDNTVQFLNTFQNDLVQLHAAALENLVYRCCREPRWHCAKADVLLNPISRQRLSSSSGESNTLRSA
ncbi:hypothetical protein PsorP6_001236 [Peronosclerospora sorghi]|uniref:Uncharacterized protein n=1 Tax=Peronosclerospora sorghi TaxID=230839 RepID=A0ACC0WVE6_9STRA|nr:hypothetical protein PsorP6_001236 [Peronosclerospora sorghi]